MFSLSSIGQWLAEQFVPVLFVFFALLMGVAMVFISARNRRASLNRDRSGRTEETFAEYLAAYGFDPDIARLTYRYLQERQGVAFPIEPADDLDRNLGLDEDDIERSLRDLLDQTGREYLPGLVSSPLVTVVDLVRCIQASPRRVSTIRRRRTA